MHVGIFRVLHFSNNTRFDMWPKELISSYERQWFTCCTPYHCCYLKMFNKVPTLVYVVLLVNPSCLDSMWLQVVQYTHETLYSQLNSQDKAPKEDFMAVKKFFLVILVVPHYNQWSQTHWKYWTNNLFTVR